MYKLTTRQLPEPKPFNKTTTLAHQLTIQLRKWIQSGLEDGTLLPGHGLPLRAELVEHFGVSVGTIQTALRSLEDEGWFESKQRLGTFISRPDASPLFRKQISKRDRTVVELKRYININYRIPHLSREKLPAVRHLASILKVCPSLVQEAVHVLVREGILSPDNEGRRYHRHTIVRVPDIDDGKWRLSPVKNETLTDQIETDIRTLITNHTPGSLLPTHQELAYELRTSIKTVHDAMTRIRNSGLVSAVRGYYGGTVVL
jgi:DNA-binding GntR family transcriptional regulator